METYYYYLIGMIIIVLLLGLYLVVIKLKKPGRPVKPVMAPDIQEQPAQPVPVRPYKQKLTAFGVELEIPEPAADPILAIPVEQAAPPASVPEPVETISKTGVFNALVLDDKTHSFGERSITLLPGKDYGRPLLYGNNLLFFVHRLASGQIEVVPASPYENLEHSPGETYEACRNTQDIREIFGKQRSSDKMKVWLFILGALAALFIMWMAATSMQGG